MLAFVPLSRSERARTIAPSFKVSNKLTVAGVCHLDYSWLITNLGDSHHLVEAAILESVRDLEACNTTRYTNRAISSFTNVRHHAVYSIRLPALN